MVVPVTAPSDVTVPSPKSTTTLRMTVPLPVTGATEAVNAISVPAVGLVVVALIETAGCGRGLTATEVDAVTTLPKLSVTVARIVNVPAEANVCETVVAAVIAPRCCSPLPSPQSTVTSLIADPFVAGTATVNVNVAGSPALG